MVHDESTDSDNSTNAENSESGREAMIPIALDALTASTRDTSSLPGELLSEHTLRFRNTESEKSVQITRGDTR